MIKLIVENYLNEGSYIDFGGQANPPYGWAVCLAGGPGSGKGYVQDKFFLLDFTKFDVDELKKKINRSIKNSNSPFKKYVDRDNYDFGNPDDVSALHGIVKRGGWNDKLQKNVLADNRYLPNVLFDVTGDDPNKLIKNAKITKDLGYNTALVWVITNREEAMVRNVLRDRTVGDAIFHSKHNTINEKLYNFITTTAGQYFDECWIVFNSNPHAGGTDEESKWLQTNRVIKLRKVGDTFVPTTKEFRRILTTLGGQETNPENPEVYVDQQTTKDIVNRRGGVTSVNSTQTDWGTTNFRR
jgi:hypothetical protein